MAPPKKEKRPCSIDGCEKFAWARGWCGTHYRRWEKTGDPNDGGRFTRTLREKFENRMGGPPPEGDECWLWPGGVDKDGYGEYKVDGHRRAHRVSHTLYIGEIPDGALILHSCDTPACCLPSHLSIGTQKKNMDEMRERRRNKVGEEHHKAVFTEADVRGIRAMFTSGDTVSVIAARYGVSRWAVDCIVKRRTWKHVI